MMPFAVIIGLACLAFAAMIPLSIWEHRKARREHAEECRRWAVDKALWQASGKVGRFRPRPGKLISSM